MDKLADLYRDAANEFKKVKSLFPDADLAGPFLMAPNELYYNQKKKLMIVGQQTNGWTYFIDDLDKQQTSYQEFELGKNYFSSPFWNVTRKLENVLGNQPYSCVWTNINKFDVDADKPYGQYEIAISKLDYLLINEISILHPDICMFFTGPTFDTRLKKVFPGLEFISLRGWESRQFCQLQHKLLPELSFRSYHPKSLRMQQLENYFLESMKVVCNGQQL